MKERDTVIIPIRIKKHLIPKITQAVEISRKPTRNSWLIWAIGLGLRPHKKRREVL